MLRVGNKLSLYFREFLRDVSIDKKEEYSLKGYYLLHSEELWGITTNELPKKFSLDNNNVLVTQYNQPIYKQYNPAYIAYYGLINYNRYLETKTNIFLERFLASITWIQSNAISHVHDTIQCQKWTYQFDWENGDSKLLKGWSSSMAQGLISSLLIRGYFYSEDEYLLIMAKEAVNLYKVNIEDGGVKARYKEYEYYEEYPSYPLSMVLDGALFALIGVYEVSELDSSYKKILKKGLLFIENNFFKIWNYHNIWTKYGIFSNTQYLSTNGYHQLNLVLLDFFIAKNLLTIKKINTSNKYFISIINIIKIVKGKI